MSGKKLNKRDDDFIYFQGSKISKREANKVGLGLICGAIGAVISTVLFDDGFLSWIIIIAFASFGLFFLSEKILKK